MSKSSDPTSDRYTEMKDDERMIGESRGVVYNTHRLNDETRKIMLDNEKKTPTRVPDDHRAHLKRILRTS